MVSIQKDPQLYMSIKVSIKFRSNTSTPLISTSIRSIALITTTFGILPTAFTYEETLTLLSKRLAILGIPLALEAIPCAPSSSMDTPRIPAERITILVNSSVL